MYQEADPRDFPYWMLPPRADKGEKVVGQMDDSLKKLYLTVLRIHQRGLRQTNFIMRQFGVHDISDLDPKNIEEIESEMEPMSRQMELAQKIFWSSVGYHVGTYENLGIRDDEKIVVTPKKESDLSLEEILSEILGIHIIEIK